MESGGLWDRLVDSHTGKYIMDAYMMLVGLERSK